MEERLWVISRKNSKVKKIKVYKPSYKDKQFYIKKVDVIIEKMKNKFLKIGVLLIILGAFVALLSNFSVVAEVGWEERRVASIVGSNVLGFEVLEDIESPLRVNLNGSYFFGDSPRLRIYNQNEQIIFSYPIAQFPVYTNIYEKGVFTLVLEDVILDSASYLNVNRMAQVNEEVKPFEQIRDFGAPIGFVGLIVLIICFYLILTEKTQNAFLNDENASESEEKWEKYLCPPFTSLNEFWAFLLPAYTYFAFGAFVFPTIFSWFNIPDNSSYLTISLSVIVTAFALLYVIFFRRILKSKLIKINFRKLILLREISGFLSMIISFLGTTLVISIPLVILFNNFGFLPLALFTFWTAVVVYIPFVPFSYILSDNGLAYILLELFKDEHQENPEKANFSLLTNAVRKIVEMTKSYNLHLSRKLLGLGLIYRILEEKKDGLNELSDFINNYPQGRRELIIELKTLMTKGACLEKVGFNLEFPRFSSERLGSFFKNGLPIISLILAILNYFLSVFGLL